MGGFAPTADYMISAAIELRDGNADRALELALKAKHNGISAGFTVYELEFADLLAAAYHEAGDLKEAEKTLKETLGMYGGHAIAHYQLGKVYEDMNRPEDALQEFEVFLEMWSEADEGLAELEDARRRLAGLGD